MAVPPRTVRFGPYEADLRTGELRRSGVLLELQELPFRMLAALLERPGDLLTREELRALLWPAGVHVDFEHGLNKAANKIRAALGDDPDAPSYLETLPRRGYRFVASVEYEDAAPAAPVRSSSARLLWSGRTVPLSEGENLLGRDPDASVWIDSSTVSRRHARILVSSGHALLEDLGSKNGTLRNGRKLAAPETLADGDEIVVGSASLTFRCAAGDESTQTETR